MHWIVKDLKVNAEVLVIKELMVMGEMDMVI